MSPFRISNQVTPISSDPILVSIACTQLDHAQYPVHSMMASRTAADAAIKAGQAKLAHPIGHVHVQMSCEDADGKRLDIPLTGQTGGGSEWQVGICENSRTSRADRESK
jgi:hypothetical protein